MPAGALYSPDAGVWLAAKTNGQSSLLPTGEQNWFEDLARVEEQRFGSNAGAKAQLYAAYSALDQDIVGHVIETPSGELDLSTLDAAQRQAVIEHLLSIAEQSRNVMRKLVSYSSDNEYILSTPGNQLDDQQAINKFISIARENLEAHPDLRYTFSAK